MNLDLFIDLIPVAVSASWAILLFMWDNLLLAGPLLLAMYLLLMRVWILAKGQWWELPFKIVGGILFLPADAFVNVFVCTPLFLELPKAFLVTHRMQRYKGLKRDSLLNKWRYGFAVKLCRILNVPQQKLTGTNHC